MSFRIGVHATSPRTATRGEGAALLPALLLMLVTLVGTFLIGTMPREGQTQYAVIAAPWAEMVGLVTAADGALVEAGKLVLEKVPFNLRNSLDGAMRSLGCGQQRNPSRCG